jgi:ADP-heptose:LPS heptosyltransferase
MITCLKLQFLRLLYFLNNIFISLIRNLLWPRTKPAIVKTICIYRIGNIGDIVCAIPAMYSIRQSYPDSRLIIVSSPGEQGMPGAYELLSHVSWIDELMIFYSNSKGANGKNELIAKLKKESIDLYIELPNNLSTLKHNLRNMFFARYLGASWGAGWNVSTIKIFSPLQSEKIRFPNEVDRLSIILSKFKFLINNTIFRLEISKENYAKAKELLNNISNKKIIAVAPGAKRKTNRWPIERYFDIVLYLVNRGYAVVLIGSKYEKEECRKIAEVNENTINLAGETSLLESIAVLSKCSLLICNDSGVQHLSSAVGVKSISLFSARDIKGKWHPYGNNNSIIRKRPECHTCFLEVCPYDNKCMKMIQTNEVIDIINEYT